VTFHYGTSVKVKSVLERDVAEWLTEHEVPWLYEPDTIKLANGRRYTPDFRVGYFFYIEVKYPVQGDAVIGSQFYRRDLQSVELLREKGVRVEVVRSIEDLESLFGKRG